jgi:hypothetical protein
MDMNFSFFFSFLFPFFLFFYTTSFIRFYLHVSWR